MQPREKLVGSIQRRYAGSHNPSPQAIEVTSCAGNPILNNVRMVTLPNSNTVQAKYLVAMAYHVDNVQQSDYL